jgi:hypothetical protein
MNSPRRERCRAAAKPNLRLMHHFCRSEAMPVGQKHHERVAMAVAVLPNRLDDLLDLVGGEVLAGAQLRVRGAT